MISSENVLKYEISNPAGADIESIAARIAADRPRAADRWLRRLYRTFELLGRNQKLGRVRPELPPEVRSFSMRPFTIYYRITSHKVSMIRILHGRQATTI